MGKGPDRVGVPHVFVIDAEYERRPYLAELLGGLREHSGERTILLLSQYGGAELVGRTARFGVDGLILRT